MARPVTYTDETIVAISSVAPVARLQANSDRRALINLIIDKGGRMSMGEIDDHYKFSMRPAVLRLLRDGWLITVREDAQ